MKTKFKIAIVALIAAFGALIPFSASNAAPVSITASTHYTHHQDSGGNGDWATLSFTRKLTITQTRPHHYVATIHDAGTFKTTNGAYVPNQGAPYTGLKITKTSDGTFSGFAEFVFTSNTMPKASLVPLFVNGAGPQTTSNWFKTAFPDWSTFGGSGIVNSGRDGWGWFYQLCDKVHVGGDVYATSSQTWLDSASTNDGQSLSDGQIFG